MKLTCNCRERTSSGFEYEPIPDLRRPKAPPEPPIRSQPPNLPSMRLKCWSASARSSAENLKRLDDDIDILTKYLKSEDAPKAVISTLEGMRVKQHESWKAAVERIEKIFEE